MCVCLQKTGFIHYENSDKRLENDGEMGSRGSPGKVLEGPLVCAADCTFLGSVA